MAKQPEDREALQQAECGRQQHEEALARLRESELALDTQKAFSDQLLATVQVAVIVLDEHGRVVYINPFLERLSGYRLAEVLEKDWFTTFLPEREHERIKALFTKAIDGVQTQANISAIVTKTGEERLIRWYDHLLPAWAGNEHWLIASGVDVTELERVRQTVRYSEHRFRVLIDTLPQGIFLKGVDSTYVTCNMAHARMLGLDSPKQIIGRSDEDFFPAELVKKFRADDRRVIDSGEAVDMEERVVVDGRAITVQTVKTPMRDEHGKVSGVLGIYWDIGERKTAELGLKESESRFRSYVEHSPVAIFVFDAEGRCRDANPASEAMLACDRKALLAMGIVDVVGEDDSARALAAFSKLREQGYHEGEYRFVCRDGRRIWVMARSIRIAQDRYLSFCQDITERKREEILLQARLRLNDMATAGDHQQLMRVALDFAEELTGSNIGFFHFVEEDQRTILLQAWSTNTIAHMCKTDGAGEHYAVDKAGVWADAIRSGRPVIHDDYAALADKKGMPEGHAGVKRLATVPILRHGKVVAAIGIGNKPQAYLDQDVEILSQLADMAWDIIEVDKAEQALKLSEETYRSLFDHMLNGLAFCRMEYEDGRPKDFIYLNVNDNFEKLTGLKDVVGRRVSEVIPGIRESDPELFEAYGRVAMGGEPERFEIYVKGLDMWFWLSVYSPKPEHFVAVFDVITERKKAELALEHANRALMTLGTVNRELVHAVDEAELMCSICEAIVEQKGYRMAWVGYARDNAEKDVEIAASSGVPEAMVARIRPGWGADARAAGPTGRAVRTGKTQVSPDIASEPYHAWKDDVLKAGCVSSIALSLKGDQGRVFGVLHVYAEVADAFTEGEIRLLEEMAGDLAFGVRTMRIRKQRDEAMQQNVLHQGQIRQNLEETIAAIAKAVEARDPYTAGHQRRVAELAVAIGRHMKLGEETLECLHMGATIHDIGKLQVPAEILTKPTRLSAVEYALVKLHPQVGYEILKDIHFPWPVAEIAYQHHERPDGSGYPQGLKGDEICMEARIVAVADVVEAMSSHRPYRGGLGVEAALAEIGEHKGTRYDADIVDACLAVFADDFRFA